MTPEFVLGFFFESMKTALLLAAPMLLVGLTAGITVSIFQAATQINEMTLVFIPKMFSVALAILIFFPWMMQLMVDFLTNVITNIPQYVR